MKIYQISSIFLLGIVLQACIGDDIVDDYVDPEIRITNGLQSLKLGDSHQFEATFFNNIGQEEALNISWSSSDQTIISIDETGFATGEMEGTAQITAVGIYQGTMIEHSIDVDVSDETIVLNPGDRIGTLRSTSSYLLKGTFILKEENSEIILELLDDYETTDVLPGLYIYLTNNPNTVNGAYEIGMVTVFEGSHSYNMGSQFGINSYKYVLYYCKPFSVKVGDGEFEN